VINPGLLKDFTPAECAVVREVLLRDHLEFSKFFYRAVTNAPMLVGRHHALMGSALDRVILGQIKHLIISVPPRYTKTIFAVVMLVARGMAINPRSKFIHLSYAQDLVMKNSADTKDVIASPEYQALWPMALRSDSSGKALWETDKGGEFRATSAGGQVTGFGAGLMEPGFTGALIVDDALKPDDASSETKREFINERFTNTIRSRRADENTPMIVIMQRVHNNDLAGYLLRGGSGDHWHHLNLPVLIDEDYTYPTEYTHGIPIEHELSPGPLWEAKHSLEQIGVLRRDGKTFASQYMQDPRLSMNPAFPMSAFNSYEVRPRTLTVAILVDPSEGASKTSDRTAMAVIGIDQSGNKYLLDGYCHRMSLSERWTALKTLHQRWQRAPGVAYVAVGYEKYGMQSDLAYIRERQEIEGAHFPIEEINWPRSGGHAKEDRIQRLEPDFKGSRFFLPAVIWRQEEGGECYWTAEDHGISYTRSRGPTSAMRRVSDGGEAWRVAQAIKRRDENGQLYDITQTLINELKDFPNASHDDFSDAASRVYDLTIQSVSNKEMNEAAALNEMDIWS
jgi:phage terminase large subunit-like protein